MASVDSPLATGVDNGAREARSMPNVSAHDPLPTAFGPNITAPTTDNVAEEQPAEINRTTSLFGPYPSGNETSSIGQQTVTVTGSTQTAAVPSAISADQIEPPKHNMPSTTHPVMPPLNFDGAAYEPINSTPANKPSSPTQAGMPALTREKTGPAIGPATDKPTPMPKESEIEGPVLFITLLLTSTGTRHPYKLDEKYLKKRNVVVDGNNPVNISLYKLKELILRDWRDGEQALS